MILQKKRINGRFSAVKSNLKPSDHLLLGAVHKLYRLKGDQKLQILPSKKMIKKGEGVKNRQFRDNIVYGWPLSSSSFNVGKIQR